MIENIKDFIDEMGLREDAIVLEPQEDFNKGIIGVTEDKCHIVYSFEKLAESLAESYKKESLEGKDENTELMKDEDYYIEAVEWLDYNTIRQIDFMNKEFAPIIMYEV